ncbi:MAG: hypothetical protein QNJ04_11715 [Desulfobacterales bacterium]|nr:hypothetical protein [Desulfobacterales bacterium]
MTPSAILLVLLSATIHVGWNFLTKSSRDPAVFSLLKGTSMAAVAVAGLSMLPLAAIPEALWIFVLVSGLLHGVYILALSKAYESGDISYVYPIARSAPALVPVAAFLIIGETISMRGGVGIFIVVLGVIALQFRGRGRAELLAFKRAVLKKDSVWAFVTLGAVVSYSLVDKAAMVALSDVTAIPPAMRGPCFFMLQVIFCYLFFWGYMAATRKLQLKGVWTGQWRQIIVAAVGTMASYSLILHVMQSNPVSYIVSLRQSSVLLAVLVGWLQLKEPYGIYRLVTSGVMLAGFYLVSTAGG